MEKLDTYKPVVIPDAMKAGAEAAGLKECYIQSSIRDVFDRDAIGSLRKAVQLIDDSNWDTGIGIAGSKCRYTCGLIAVNEKSPMYDYYIKMYRDAVNVSTMNTMVTRRGKIFECCNVNFTLVEITDGVFYFFISGVFDAYHSRTVILTKNVEIDCNLVVRIV